MSRSGEHLLGMIDDVLDLSKIEAGRVEIEQSSFDLQKLLGDAVELFRPRASQRICGWIRTFRG